MFNLVKRIQDGDISVGEMMVIYQTAVSDTAGEFAERIDYFAFAFVIVKVVLLDVE